MAKTIATDKVAYAILEDVRKEIIAEGEIASPSMSDAIRKLAKKAGIDLSKYRSGRT